MRKLAAEHNVDLSTLTGTGVGGRIRKQDVLEAAGTPAAAGRAGAGARPRPHPRLRRPSRSRARCAAAPRSCPGIRAVIAKRMLESLQVSAQLTTVVEVDVTKIAQLRDRAKDAFQQRHGVKLSFLPFFALAAVEALQIHPVVNA